MHYYYAIRGRRVLMMPLPIIVGLADDMLMPINMPDYRGRR